MTEHSVYLYLIILSLLLVSGKSLVDPDHNVQACQNQLLVSSRDFARSAMR